MTRVTVVPADRLIIVNGEALQFDYPAPPNLHALQWDGTAQSGHMEWTDDYNMALDASLYAEEVAPYVQLWEAEKARLAAEAEAAEAARLAEYNSMDARYARLRAKRDQRLAAHDNMVSLLTRKQRLGIDVSEQLQALDAYAEQLCNLPAQDGAPWDGGGEATPWPDMPAI